MTRQDAHVSAERLAALALAPACDPLCDDDRAALDHVSGCEECSLSLASMTVEVEALREAAHREADMVFGEAALSAQRQRILDKLAHLGQAARVLAFPAARRRSPLSPAAPAARRWISVAAAAGLIIGLVAGQTLHFLPGDTTHLTVTAEPPARTMPGIVQASLGRPLSEDELLYAIENAADIRAVELQALDELTPVFTEIP